MYTDIHMIRVKQEEGLALVTELDTVRALLVVLVDAALGYTCLRYVYPAETNGVSVDHRNVDAAQAFRWLALRAPGRRGAMNRLERRVARVKARDEEIVRRFKEGESVRQLHRAFILQLMTVRQILRAGGQKP